jgi:hypothetical protein
MSGIAHNSVSDSPTKTAKAIIHHVAKGVGESCLGTDTVSVVSAAAAVSAAAIVGIAVPDVGVAVTVSTTAAVAAVVAGTIAAGADIVATGAAATAARTKNYAGNISPSLAKTFNKVGAALLIAAPLAMGTGAGYGTYKILKDQIIESQEKLTDHRLDTNSPAPRF